MRRLVICCDGTWNAVDGGRGRPTNVAKIAQAIDTGGHVSKVDQIVAYVRGVGSTGLKTQRVFSGATGDGVDDNIRSAYLFLVQNFRPGDAIYLFGFSRGAFTARALAGMIKASGLPTILSRRLLTLAWNHYRTPPRERRRRFAEIIASARHIDDLRGLGRPLFHEGVEIQFVGVFDTVGALGIPSYFSDIRARWALPDSFSGFHDTQPSSIVRFGAHALAVDDHRPSFVPTLWTGARPAATVIDQTWFAGNHSDVGGGHDEDTLSRVPLHWMVRKAEAAGLVFDRRQLPPLLPPTSAGKSAAYLARHHDSNVGLYAANALRPLYRTLLGRVPPEDALPTGALVAAERDWRGNPRPGINEKLHVSLLERWGEKFGAPDALETPDRAYQTRYRPANLLPFFGQGGSLADGTPVDTVI